MAESPNLLLIITDHQAYYGHHRPGEFEYRWPNFERFASQGVCFRNAWTVCPLCSPARASMMTGQYPSRHGMLWNNEQQHSANLSDFRPGQQLYSHHLARAGYRNAYIGKWHCGTEKLPTDYGIEGWSLPDYGKVYMSEAYRDYAAERGFGSARARIEHDINHPEWEGTTQVLHHESPWHFMNGSGVLEGPPEAHEEQFVAHLSINKLRELAADDQPWSLVASFWGPHQPYFPTEPYASMIEPESIPVYPSFDDDLAGRPLRHVLHREMHHPGAKRWRDWSIWQQVLARCYGQGLQTDAAIGSILRSLDELGMADNTLVVWCADHGDAVASHGGLWDKASTFTEEVSRVPLAVRWPNVIEAGKTQDALVSNMDVTATLLNAAGVDIPEEMDSRSLLPLSTQYATVEWPDQLVCEHNGHCEDLCQLILLHDQFKYVTAMYDGDEFYDLRQDPYELNNLISDPDYAEMKQEMTRRLLRHIEQSKNWRLHLLGISLRYCS